jgi:hypothetical protein
VCEEGLRVVKHFYPERNALGEQPGELTVPEE